MFIHIHLLVVRISLCIWLSSMHMCVGGGAGTEGIMLADESFRSVREVWNHVGDVAGGDVFSRGM